MVSQIVVFQMEFSKPSAFTKQIAIYISNGDKDGAVNTAKDFILKFPDEIMAHMLLAMASLMAGNYEIAKNEGRKAFNMTSNPDDMLSCAIIAAMAHFQLKEYEKGYEILSVIEPQKSTAQLEEMLVIFSILIDNPDMATKHYSLLFKMNSKLAEELFMRIIGQT